MWEKIQTHINKMQYDITELDDKTCLSLHKHCLVMGLFPGTRKLKTLDNLAQQRFLERFTPVIISAKKLLPKAYLLLPDPVSVLILTDAGGRVIYLFSSAEIVTSCEKKGILSGTALSEEACGTNAVALALQNQKPAIVKGPQHFFQMFHNWSCVAIPIFDGQEQLAGTINIATRCKSGLSDEIPLAGMLAEQFSPIFPYRSHKIQSPNCDTKSRSLFSPRQTLILKMVANGLTSKEIGNKLSISARTVETHLERMRTRTGSRTSAQLVALAFSERPSSP